MGSFPMSAEANKGTIRYLFVFYPIPIRPNVKIDRNKGTKKRVKHRTRWRYVVNERHEKAGALATFVI